MTELDRLVLVLVLVVDDDEEGGLDARLRAVTGASFWAVLKRVGTRLLTTERMNPVVPTVAEKVF
jgi:hypothetical protein